VTGSPMIFQTAAGGSMTATATRQLSLNAAQLTCTAKTATFQATTGAITWEVGSGGTNTATITSTSDVSLMANPTTAMNGGSISLVASGSVTTASKNTNLRAANDVVLLAQSINLAPTGANPLVITSQLSNQLNAINVACATDTLNVQSAAAVRLSAAQTTMSATTTTTLTAANAFNIQTDFLTLQSTGGAVSLNSATLQVSSDLISATAAPLTLTISAGSGPIVLGTTADFGSITAPQWTISTATGVTYTAGKSLFINSWAGISATTFLVSTPTGIDLSSGGVVTFQGANVAITTSDATADFYYQAQVGWKQTSNGWTVQTEASLGQFDAESISSRHRYDDDGIQVTADNGNLSLLANGAYSITSVNGDVIFGARRAIAYNANKMGFFGQTPSAKITGTAAAFSAGSYCNGCTNVVCSCVSPTNSLKSVWQALVNYGFLS